MLFVDHRIVIVEDDKLEDARQIIAKLKGDQTVMPLSVKTANAFFASIPWSGAGLGRSTTLR